MTEETPIADEQDSPLDQPKKGKAAPLGIIDNEETRELLSHDLMPLDEFALPEFPWVKGTSFRVDQFICAYRGDVEEAAGVAGLSVKHCQRLLDTDINVRYALQCRLQYMVAPEAVAGSEERKAMLSNIARDPRKVAGERIAAMTLISKMEGELIDKREIAGGGTPLQILVDTGVPDADPSQLITSTVQAEIITDDGYEGMDEEEENA